MSDSDSVAGDVEPAAALLRRVRRALGDDAPSKRSPRHPVPLSARTGVPALAWASVTAASLAAAEQTGAPEETVDPERIALAYTSERHVRVDGRTPTAWGDLSGFFEVQGGWVRTHANYPHHAAALRRGLGLSATAGRAELARSLGGLEGGAACDAVTAAGGLCVPVRREDPGQEQIRRRLPIISLRRVSDGSHPVAQRGPRDAPLRGIRVLDLTRVIAGPVATRTLALLGADVLRVDPPGLAESEWVHLDTGHGKRSTLLDVRAAARRAALERLLAGADAIVTGYRAHALALLGLSPPALIARHPGLIVARLSAWGADERRAADRRGFDSLVQAESGIAWIESVDGSTPGVLPAQALDHSAGYLLAAGIMTALRRRRAEGGAWMIDVSLRRIAAELLGMPRTPEPAAVEPPDATPHLQHFDVDGIALTTVAPALSYPGAPDRFAAPRRWGRDAAEWAR